MARVRLRRGSTVLITILLIGALVLGIWCINGLLRNDRVHKERLRIIAAISAAAQADIEAGRFDSWEWRYDVFDNGPSHGRMVMEIWKPVSSYRSEFERATG